MGLLRDRGTPYAPLRQPQKVDWAAMRRAEAAARAERAAVDEIGRRNIQNFHRHKLPESQLTERCHSIEQQIAGLSRAVELLGEQVQTIITNLEPNDA
jgi:hypothetical protein